MQIVKVLFLLLVVSQLVACSGEPTESDIAAAVTNQLKTQLKSTGGIFNEDDVSINSIKKIGCTEAKEKSGYHCDINVDIDIKMPFIGTQKQQGIQSLRLIKTDNGWEAAR